MPVPMIDNTHLPVWLRYQADNLNALDRGFLIAVQVATAYSLKIDTMPGVVSLIEDLKSNGWCGRDEGILEMATHDIVQMVVGVSGKEPDDHTIEEVSQLFERRRMLEFVNADLAEPFGVE